MIGLSFESPVGHVACLGAHPDDIEVGAAGLLGRLASMNDETRFTFAIAAGDETRATEAKASASDLLGDRVDVICGNMTDGFLPYSHARETKEFLKAATAGPPADLVIAPHIRDRHQDHRFIAELAHQLFRTHMILEYEIVKLEGDLGAPNVYVPLTGAEAERKLDHIDSHFETQHEKAWYNRHIFSGLMRLRGVESLAPDGFAEAFHATRIRLG